MANGYIIFNNTILLSKIDDSFEKYFNIIFVNITL